MIDFSEKGNSVIFKVRVISRASKSEIVGDHDGALKIKLKSPPVDGAANAELIKLLAEIFDVSKGDVEIVSGAAARTKQIKVSALSRNKFLRFLETNFAGKQ